MTPAQGPSRQSPIASLLAAIVFVVVLVTLFVVLLPVALALVGALILIILAMKAKAAFDRMGASGAPGNHHVPKRDREGRRNVRVINR